MKLHRNAKSTPASRLALVQKVIFEGRRQAETADGFGVIVRTVAKWDRRFRTRGGAGLEDGSSRPGEPVTSRLETADESRRTRHRAPQAPSLRDGLAFVTRPNDCARGFHRFRDSRSRI